MRTPYIWTQSGTDITIRWRAQYGWIPPSEQQEYRDKWKYWQNLPLRSLDAEARELYEIALQKAKIARIK
jgi:hypothetical protein